MIESSEIYKKECPGGMHAHTGYTVCHPLDKPHKPGTSADVFHAQVGIPNSWYEKHGTTREQYMKEHPERFKDEGGSEESEKEEEKPEEDSEQEESNDESFEVSDDSKAVVECKGLDEIRRSNPEQFKRVERYQSRWKEVRDNPDMSNTQKYFEVFKSQDWEFSDEALLFGNVTIDPIFNDIPSDEFNYFVDNVMESIKQFPDASFAFESLVDMKKKRGEDYCRKVIMSFSSSFVFNCNTDLAFKEMARRRAWTDTGGNYPQTSDARLIDIYDPVTGESSQWSFHFTDSDETNSIQHEFGHAVGYVLACLYSQKENPSVSEYSEISDAVKSVDMQALNQGYSSKPYVDARIGMWPIRSRNEDSRQFESDAKQYPYVINTGRAQGPEDAERMRDAVNERIMPLGFELDSKPTKYTLSGVECYGYRIKRRAMDGKYSWDEVSKGDLQQGCMDNTSLFWTNRTEMKMNVKRVRECEKLYKKIYNLDTIQPSDVYSAYGYYAEAVGMRSGKHMSEAELNGKRGGEILAEAFNDVGVRKDRSNSMSRLLVAHTYYEYAVIKLGYTGTFEDYIRDKVGMDKFKERIIKGFGMPIWYHYLAWADEDRRIAKGFRKDTPDYVMKAYRQDTKDMQWSSISYKGRIIRQFKKSNKQQGE